MNTEHFLKIQVLREKSRNTEPLTTLWGRHFLVKTKNPKTIKTKNDEAKIDERDMNTVDAETLIYSVFKEDQLQAFENLPAKTRNRVEGNINKIIENVRGGKIWISTKSFIIQEIEIPEWILNRLIGLQCLKRHGL